MKSFGMVNLLSSFRASVFSELKDLDFAKRSARKEKLPPEVTPDTELSGEVLQEANKNPEKKKVWWEKKICIYIYIYLPMPDSANGQPLYFWG